MLASIPASMVNQNPTDLGIPIRFNLSSSRFSRNRTTAGLSNARRMEGPAMHAFPKTCAEATVHDYVEVELGVTF
jgi:hypothetical protein